MLHNFRHRSVSLCCISLGYFCSWVALFSSISYVVTKPLLSIFLISFSASWRQELRETIHRMTQISSCTEHHYYYDPSNIDEGVSCLGSLEFSLWTARQALSLKGELYLLFISFAYLLNTDYSILFFHIYKFHLDCFTYCGFYL